MLDRLMDARRLLTPRTVAYLVLGWAAAWFGVMAVGGGSSWHFFLQGATALADADDPVNGGLHLYAAAPVLQIGPLTFLAVLLLLPAGGVLALLGWQILGAAAGLLLLWMVRGLVPRWQRDDAWLALAAGYFLPVWMFLAVGVAHLDDVLALLLSVGALRAARTGHGWLTGLLLGLATDAKPWAIGFAAILLLVPGWRRRLAAGGVLLAAVGAAWLPFFVGDRGTSNALRYTIQNAPVSALHALGIDDPRTPAWDRPAQLALALTLGALAVWRGQWAAIPLLAVASRLVLEPGGNKYYIAGVVVATVIWDYAGARPFLPWWTMSACLGLFVARWMPMPAVLHGWALIALFVSACVLLSSRRPFESTTDESRPPGAVIGAPALPPRR
ncbi:glycosyltransferase 87 family protein [Dactylosporangium sp. NPDC051541]|uniref:glycosyltransferase 87 family protein n=1 Tax=Dactylosporangium sp. NPDC051541 TaxID=3363977 RepID=UPI0037883B26